MGFRLLLFFLCAMREVLGGSNGGSSSCVRGCCHSESIPLAIAKSDINIVAEIARGGSQFLKLFAFSVLASFLFFLIFFFCFSVIRISYLKKKIQWQVCSKYAGLQ